MTTTRELWALRRTSAACFILVRVKGGETAIRGICRQEEPR